MVRIIWLPYGDGTAPDVIEVWLGSVDHLGKSSHNHDRDDHGATKKGDVRMTIQVRQS